MKTHSPETRQAISAAVRRYWAERKAPPTAAPASIPLPLAVASEEGTPAVQPVFLLGKAQIDTRQCHKGQLAPPFGELVVDAQGQRAVVVTYRRRRDILTIQGLEYEVEEGPGTLVKVTYRKA